MKGLVERFWDFYGRRLGKAVPDPRISLYPLPKDKIDPYYGSKSQKPAPLTWQQWFAVKTRLGRWLDRRWGRFLCRRIRIVRTPAEQLAFDEQVRQAQAVERAERARILAKYKVKM